MGGSKRRVLLAVGLGLVSLAALFGMLRAADSQRCAAAAALLASGQPEMSLQTYARLGRRSSCRAALATAEP